MINKLFQLSVAILILMGFLIVRRFFSKYILARLKVHAEKEKSRLDPKILEALDKPIQLVPVALGFFFAFGYLQPEGVLRAFASQLVLSLVVFALFWAAYNLISPFSHAFRLLEGKLTDAMLEFFVKLLRVLLVFIGLASILEIWGIKVAPILAGLGLFGVAIALGAQDLFKNLIAGLLIVGEKRFNKGDLIQVEGLVEGRVEQLGFRSTLVRRPDRAPVYIPNAKLSDSAVINDSAKTHRRIYWHIGLDHRTTRQQLEQIRDEIEAYIFKTPAFATPSDVPTYVRVDQFSEGTIELLVCCFTKSIQLMDWLNSKEQLALEIKDVVARAGASFSQPGQTIYVDSSDKPEA